MIRKTAAAMKPGFGRTLDLPFAEAIRRAEQALAHQGFGILTRIDIRATLGEKLGVDHPPHVILGACNPSLAGPGARDRARGGLASPLQRRPAAAARREGTGGGG